MNTLRRFLAIGPLLGMGLALVPTTAEADNKTQAGWVCRDIWGDSNATHLGSYGTIENESTTAYTFGCPLVKDEGDLDDVKIRVTDRSPTDGFSCVIAERDRWGGGFWSASRGTSGAFLGTATIDFADGDAANGDADSIYVLHCVIPGRDITNGRSMLHSIRWSES